MLLASTSASGQPGFDPFEFDGVASDQPADEVAPPPAAAADRTVDDAQPLPPAPRPSAEALPPAPPRTQAAPPSDPPPEPPPLAPPTPTPVTPAVTPTVAPQLSGAFTVRLARAPKMMGDFFGRGFSTASGRMLVGESAFQSSRAASSLSLSAQPDPFGLNNFRLIETQTIADTTPFDVDVYTGGTFGTAPGAVYGPGPAVAPGSLPATVEGLEGNGVGGEFVAVSAGETTDIFEVFDSNGNGQIDPGEETLDISDAPVYDIFEVVGVALPFSGPGDLIGRTRLQDNNSAMPQDRVFFDYSYFHNAALTAGGVDVSRFAPGVEKTFLGGMASVEVRVPFGVTFNSDQVSGAAPDTSSFEFGNVVVAPKVLLSSDPDLAIAVGMGVALPTGDGILISMSDGTPAVRIDNESVHLLPYFAMLYAPRGSDCFAHLFVTYDFDLNGNETFANVTGAGLESIGTWSDQHLVTLNLAFGEYVYRARSRHDRLQSVAYSAELHYTGSISDADSVSGGSFVVGDPNANLSLLNATLGGHARVGQTTFSAGYSLPLTSDDRVFDGELRLFANRAF
ncbi:MAG: hypothetical protein AAGB00_11095 [Planctomycetota bacterium]